MMDLGTFMGRQFGNTDTGQLPVEVESLAVQFKNAHKSFGSHKEPVEVMNNFNMRIPQGSIYSLLGSSGCGKTTVLSCIVGLHKLDSGTVTVFGRVPGSSGSQVPGPRVGYMPQELSLYTEFSIREIFYYFGTIFAMTSSEIKESIEFLVTFLHLPPASRRITTLSGGQKRRVSLAASLLHNPELLILDEPTVGVDPLLRRSIWKYLLLLVSKRKTSVLITTHYIEEARNSQVVGLMRNGRLLVEQAPDSLMRQYNAILLEDIVLKLCEQDSENSEVNSRRFTKEVIGNGKEMQENAVVFQNRSVTPEYESNTLGITSVSIQEYKNRRTQTPCIAREYQGAHNLAFSESPSENADDIGFNGKKSAYRLKALVLRNVCQSIRNLPYLLFVLFLPAIQMIFLCLTIGNPPKSLNIGVINHDTSFCNYSSKSNECFSGDLSCLYLDMLPKDAIRQVAFEEEADAIEAVRKGETWGMITFPTNYSVFMIDRFLSGNEADNVSLEGSTIKLDMDLSNVQIGVSLKQVFFDTLQLYMAKILKDCEYDPKISEPPIEFRTPIYGNKDISFREFTAPSTLLGILFFFPICSSAIKIILDKKQGTLDRGKVAGVKTWEFMTSFFLTEGTVLLVQSGLSFVILVNVFSIEIKGSVLLAISLAILVGISGLSLGFLFATFCNDILEAIVLAMGCFFPNFLLSGMIWPIQGMPYVLQCISYALPCTLACESIRSIISRGWGFTHLHVWPGFVTTIAWISFYWVLNVMVQRKMSRK